MNTPRLQRLDDERCLKIQLSIGDEEDVSRLWAPTFAMRIASATVKMGGIAGVGTHRAHRKSGYASLVVQESTRYFRESGHDAALLFGIADFYHRFGYAPVLPTTKLSVEVSDVEATQEPSLPSEFVARPMEPTDWPQVLAIYDANTATRSGTVLRPRETWVGFRLGSDWGRATQSFVLRDTSQRIAAYCVLDEARDECRVSEVGCTAPENYAALLLFLADQARQRNLTNFELYLPLDDGFARFCAGVCGCQFSVGYSRNSGGMMRIINLVSLFEKLRPLLSQRLSDSDWANTSGFLRLRTDEGDLDLFIEGGQIAVFDAAPSEGRATPTWTFSSPQHRLIQLVMGYRSAREIAIDAGVAVEAEALPLLEILFPVGFPWTPKTDWF